MNRFQRRPAVAELRDMPADNVVTRVVDRAEEPTPALALRVEPRRVRPPHYVGPLGRDRTGVGGVAMRMAGALRREQPVHAHQPQDAVLAYAPAERPQSDAHLAMA